MRGMQLLVDFPYFEAENDRRPMMRGTLHERVFVWMITLRQNLLCVGLGVKPTYALVFHGYKVVAY